MAATKNDAFGKGEGVNLMHPFKLEILQGKQDETSKEPTYQTSLNFHSALYVAVTKPAKSGEEYLKFEKIKISNLDFRQKIDDKFIQEKYYYCILKLIIKDLNVESASIEYVLGNKKPQELFPIKFENSENFKQTEARVILAIVINDDKYTPANAIIEETSDKKSAKTNSTYVLQCVHSNLIVTNMVFNGIPVIYPVPFAGSPTSDDGSDQLL